MCWLYCVKSSNFHSLDIHCSLFGAGVLANFQKMTAFSNRWSFQNIANYLGVFALAKDVQERERGMMFWF